MELKNFFKNAFSDMKEDAKHSTRLTRQILQQPKQSPRHSTRKQRLWVILNAAKQLCRHGERNRLPMPMQESKRQMPVEMLSAVNANYAISEMEFSSRL